jgi:hypothetical protein
VTAFPKNSWGAHASRLCCSASCQQGGFRRDAENCTRGRVRSPDFAIRGRVVMSAQILVIISTLNLWID